MRLLAAPHLAVWFLTNGCPIGADHFGRGRGKKCLRSGCLNRKEAPATADGGSRDTGRRTGWAGVVSHITPSGGGRVKHGGLRFVAVELRCPLGVWWDGYRYCTTCAHEKSPAVPEDAGEQWRSAFDTDYLR